MDWEHNGCVSITKWHGIPEINTGQFSSGGSGGCYDNKKFVGYSSFLNIINGTNKATLYRRNSFLDTQPIDAVNEIEPFWFDFKLDIPLHYPAETTAQNNSDNQQPPEPIPPIPEPPAEPCDCPPAGDFNNDGIVNLDDAIDILRYLYE